MPILSPFLSLKTFLRPASEPARWPETPFSVSAGTKLRINPVGYSLLTGFYDLLAKFDMYRP